VTNTKITSTIPAVKVAPASQSTFDAFGLSSSQTASASHQLFDAFSTPAPNPGQAQKSFKESIMSMYATSPSTSIPAALPQESIAAVQQGIPSKYGISAVASQPVKPNNQPFDPFGSIGMKSNTTSDIPFDAFSSLNLTNPTSSTSPIAPPVSSIGNNFNAVNLLDDFEPSNSKPVVSTENNGKMNLNPQPSIMDDFTDFTSAPVSTNTSSQGGIIPISSGNISDDFSLSTNIEPLPNHSRVSTGFKDLQSPSKATPVNFANLPPIEDGWSSFQ
jgi:hypothetical protein